MDFIASLPLWSLGLVAGLVLVVVFATMYVVLRFKWQNDAAILMVGGAAVSLALLPSPAIWLHWVQWWAVIVSVLVTLGLFVTALFMPKDKDDPFYWLALVFSIFGPAIGLTGGIYLDYFPWGIVIVGLIVGSYFLIRWLVHRNKKTQSSDTAPKST